MYIYFGLGVGSDYLNTAGSWYGTSYYSATGATSVVGTSGATFYITGVQLEVGSVATEFERRPYTTELQLCMRYFYKTNSSNQTYKSGGFVGNSYTTTNGVVSLHLPVRLRTAPTVTRGGSNDTFYIAGFDANKPFNLIGSGYNDVDSVWMEIQCTTGIAGYQLTYNGQASISAEL